MPMFLQIVPTLAASLLLLACSRTPINPAGTPAAPGTQPVVSQTSTDADGNTLQGFTFSLASGQPFSITLPGHATQGYKWHLVPGFDTGVVTAPADSRYGELPPNAGIGQSAPEIFDFKAAGPGSTPLTFSLYRSWEGPDKAAETRTFNAQVR